MDPNIQEAAAIERFVLNSTVPLVYEGCDRACLAGTGTLFEVNGRVFVVTARHIFDDFPDSGRLAFPGTPTGFRLYTFGSHTLVRPDDPNVDIALLHLQAPETIEKLKEGWEMLGLSNVGPPSDSGTFFLSGYPAQYTDSTTDWLTGKFATIYTERLASIPTGAKKPVDPSLDLFFSYDRSAESLDGKSMSTPELPGTSGASVWELKSSNSGVWTPESSVMVVGVQSAYIHSKYFRAKSWRAVASAIHTFDKQLADKVDGAATGNT